MPIQQGETILNGKYRILRLIGEGGMARVWLAEEPGFGQRQVAIKEPKSGVFAVDRVEILRRYEREIEVGAALRKARTPNVVEAITAEPYEDTRLLVLDYMPGGDLAALIGQHPQGLPIDLVLRIAGDVLTALAAVHEHPWDIVHRDIKPSNILFDDDPMQGGRAHLADFGLAQVAGTSQDLTKMLGGVMGTPLYAAPEQEQGKGYLTPAVDIYALGCVLFEMLTGKKYKRYKPGTRASSLREDIPAWLDELVAKAVAEDPWKRWQNGREMLAALDAGLAEERRAQEEAAERAEVARLAALERQRREKEAAEAERRRQEAERKRREEEKERSGGSRVAGNKTRRGAPLRSSETGGGSRVAGEASGGWRVADEGEGVPPPATSDGGGGPGRMLWWAVAAVAAVIFIAWMWNANRLASLFPPSTATPLPTLAPGETPVAGSAMISEKDGMEMVYVPAGEFLMGSPEGEGEDDEHPQHTVYLDAFWIDRTEVTNAMYQKCVAAGACQPNADFAPDFNGPTQPVVAVSWYEAKAYCQWVGKRLPTEAEWEKAARGTDGRKYPWGDEWDVYTTKRLNFRDKNTNYYRSDEEADDGYKLTAPVGSYPAGSSPYGALDMAGNVGEWVADWYDKDYYASSPARNPTGPASGDYRILRGGSWRDVRSDVRSAYRYGNNPDDRDDAYGFRCARPSD